MKASPMAAETVGAGLLLKAGAALGSGVLGAAIMACMDPPASRKELFTQAAVAGVGSMVFGPIAVRVLTHYFDFLKTAAATSPSDFLEVAVPIFFIVGALSWGLFGAIAKFRKLLADKAANALAKKFGVDQ